MSARSGSPAVWLINGVPGAGRPSSRRPLPVASRSPSAYRRTTCAISDTTILEPVIHRFYDQLLDESVGAFAIDNSALTIEQMVDAILATSSAA